jgi:hypothetical protein
MRNVSCQIIIEEFDVEKAKLTLNKGEAVTGAQGVGVIIERSRANYSSYYKNQRLQTLSHYFQKYRNT